MNNNTVMQLLFSSWDTGFFGLIPITDYFIIGSKNGLETVDESTTAAEVSAQDENSVGTFLNGSADSEISECFKMLPRKVIIFLLKSSYFLV